MNRAPSIAAESGDAEPVDAPFVDPASLPAALIADARDAALAAAFERAAAAAQACVQLGQQRLAEGDTGLADCLRTALDVDALASAVARLARNRSAWGSVVAKQSISILDACVEACRPLRAQHPPCRTGFDACGRAIAAARAA